MRAPSRERYRRLVDGRVPLLPGLEIFQGPGLHRNPPGVTEQLIDCSGGDEVCLAPSPPTLSGIPAQPSPTCPLPM